MADNLNMENVDETLENINEAAESTDAIQETTEIDEEVIPEELYGLTDNEVRSYVKASDKYNDIISSSATMLFVGVVGIILMVLILTKVIPLPLNPATSWLFYSVMGGIFIIFIVAGIVSFMHAKQVKIDAAAEDELIDKIKTWADENLSADTLNEGLDLSQSEELLYFGRAEKLKDALMHQFEEADEALIDEMVEETYQKIFESDKN